MRKLDSCFLIDGNSYLQAISKFTKNFRKKIKKLENKQRKDTILVKQTHIRQRGNPLDRLIYQSDL